MALELYFHPLSSYCWKALIALYETGVDFEPIQLDLQNPEHDALLRKLWPPRKFPVLKDTARDTVVPESTIIVEYLAQHYPGGSKLCPDDPDLARETRLRDRYLDLYVHNNMGKIVADALRPKGTKDPHGVMTARADLRTALTGLEPTINVKPWLMGDDFSLADCSAAPALYYGQRVVPLDDFPNCAAYLQRLQARPSFARVLKEAEPYLHWVPI
jgi:glutathione S-transferase